MRLLVAVVAAFALALAYWTAPTRAAAPDHQLFKYPYQFVDTDTCGFAIAGDYVFTNDIIDSSLATGTGTQQLHQSNVGTLTDSLRIPLGHVDV